MRNNTLSTRLKVVIRLLFWCVFFIVSFLLLLPGESLPATDFSDKFEHLLAFFILTFLGLLAYPRQRVAMGIGLVIMGCLLEAAQTVIPGRNASGLDAIANAAGVILGVIIHLPFTRRFIPLNPSRIGEARIGE